ncbi:MAG: IS3 family transposase [Gemmatimonadetes bacterium]|nr:IS3 family transposase [Gemmatimonadota bacterium]
MGHYTRSGYYPWLKRGPSARAVANGALLEVIEEIHVESDGTYGAPRVHAELPARGVSASRNRVAREMRAAGIQGVSRRRGRKTTVRGEDARPAPDLVDRDFTATGPDQLWVADHHLRRDVGRLPVPGHRAGRLEPADRGVGDGDASQDRTGAQGPGHAAGGEDGRSLHRAGRGHPLRAVTTRWGPHHPGRRFFGIVTHMFVENGGVGHRPHFHVYVEVILPPAGLHGPGGKVWRRASARRKRGHQFDDTHGPRRRILLQEVGV